MSGKARANLIIIAAVSVAVLASWLWAGPRRSRNAVKADSLSVSRIVSGYSVFAEVIEALGAGDLIVGATTSDARRLGVKSIGSHMKPDVEAIVSCEPQLVLLSSRRPAVIEVVRDKLSFTDAVVFSAHPKTVDASLELIETIAERVDKKDESRLLVESARTKLLSVSTKLKGVPELERPVVFFEVRATPSLLSCGSDSVAYDIIRKAGGRPLCKLSGAVVRMDVEAVIAGEPNFYIQQVGAMNRKPMDVSEHQILGSLECVREGRVWQIDEALISRPGPRVAEAVEKLYEILYEERDNKEVIR